MLSFKDKNFIYEDESTRISFIQRAYQFIGLSKGDEVYNKIYKTLSEAGKKFVDDHKELWIKWGKSLKTKKSEQKN